MIEAHWTLVTVKAAVRDRAIADYSLAIQFDPKLAEFYSARGTAKAVKGDLDGAIDDCDRAIQPNPKLTVAHSMLEFAKARKGARDAAIAASGSTAPPGARVQPSRNPPAPLAFLTPSAVIIATPSKPIPIPTATPRVGSNDAEYYDDRGFRYYQQKNYEQAINDYNQAIRLDPNYARAYNRRGLVYYHQKNYEQATNDYNEAIRLDPNFTDAYRNRGNAFKNQGEDEKADADFVKSAQIESSH